MTGPDPGQSPEAGPPVHPILEFSDADLAALLKRVVRATAALGVVVSLVLWLGMGWQTAALFAVGAAISIGSIYEWSRLIRHVTARLDAQKPDAQKTGAAEGRVSGFGSGVVVALFLLRLVLFAVVIYVSLKSLHGSPIALLCGLGLALAGLAWEAIRVLRG
jgi:hypothetical protein